MSQGPAPRARKAGRRLSAEEREMWRGVTRSIKPLRPDPAPPPRAEAPEPLPATTAKAAPPPSPAGLPRPAPTRSAKLADLLRRPAPVPPPSPLAPLGRRLKGRVARGAEPIDGRLDLHGLRQDEAHGALLRFLRDAQGRGAKLVLVITGKGARSGSPAFAGEGRGVLRSLVPRWLALPEFRSLVVGFETAHTGHGGEGALYVRLRRAR